MIRAVVFDLDGTLLDTAPDILAALERAVTAAGVRISRPFTSADIGPPVAEMVARRCGPLTSEQEERVVAEFRAGYDGAPLTRTRPLPGAADCVACLRARGVALHVATNKPALPTRRLLSRWFPAAFEDSVSIDSITDRRLSKEQMLGELTRRHGLEPASCVMVGDGPLDVRAGRAFGWRTAAVMGGYGDPAALRAEQPDWVVDSLAELPPLLELA